MPAAAKLLIDIAADIAKLRTDFGEANTVVQQFGAKVKAVGDTIKTALGAFGISLGISSIISFGERVTKAADDMADLAENLKFSTRDFQAFQNAAYLAGQSIEGTTGAIAKFNVFVGNALEGQKAQVELLRSIGINALPKDQAERLQVVATAITNITDAAKRSAVEVAVFGKSGQSVSAILEQWKKGASELNAELEKQGLVLSPELIARIDEMGKKSDAAAKKVEVLFAPFYFAAKSTAFDFIAKQFGIIAGYIELFSARTSTIDKMRDLLAILLAVPTGGVGLLAAGQTAQAKAQNDLNNALERSVELTKGLQDAEKQMGATSAPAELFREKIKQTEEEISKLRGFLDGKPAATMPPTTVTGAGGSDPLKVKTEGVDKFTEAMTRLKAEIEATQQAISTFESSSNLPTKEAERLAKLAGDIGLKQSQMLKGIEDSGQQEQIKATVEQLERLKFKLDELKAVQGVADEVSRKFGTGQTELADRTYFLDKALQANKISVEEYNGALKEATETAERQKLVHEGLKDGLDGLVAGFQFAAVSMSQAQTDFQAGQDLFNAGFQTISQAITEFADKGTIDFGRLAKAFAAMLIEMAAKWAAASFLKAAFGGLGGLFGGGGSGITITRGPSTPIALPGLASGGPVSAGMPYWVGESGPERFIPNTAGNIVPSGGGGNVVINNYAQARVTTSRRQSGGGMNLEVLIEPLEAMMAGRMGQGKGSLGPAIEGNYGLARQGRR